MENKIGIRYSDKNNIAFLFICFISSVLFSSCDYLMIENIVNNQTKSVLNKQALHLSDTLYIVEPFTNVYIATKDWDVVRESTPSTYYLNFDIFNHSVPQNYQPFPRGAKQVSKFIKDNYDEYLTCFNYKKNLKLSLEDSAFVSQQMEQIKQLFKEVPVKQFEIPEPLYNCLSKYGHAQFLITDVLEYYSPFSSGINVRNFYRFFVFDISTRQLSFFAYDLSAYYGGVVAADPKSNIKTYTNLETGFDNDVKKYNRKIKHGYRKALRNKK